MRIAACVALFVGVLLMPRATWAAPPSQAELIARLSDYETVPDSTTWLPGGAAMADALQQLALTVQAPTFVRMRAVRVLSSFERAIAQPRLERVLATAEKPVLVREAAMSLIRCAGTHAIAQVIPLLRETDAALRRAGIESLAVVMDSRTRAVLTQHRAVESDPRARALIDAALTTPSEP